jgi:predicted DNA-binding transcriptional regulator AlpA
MSDPLLIDATAAGKLVGLSRTTIYGLLASGTFPPPVHLPNIRRTLCTRSSIEAWVAADCKVLEGGRCVSGA